MFTDAETFEIEASQNRTDMVFRLYIDYIKTTITTTTMEERHNNDKIEI